MSAATRRPDDSRSEHPAPPVERRFAPAPRSIIWAGYLAMAEAAAATLFSIFLIVREAQGFHDPGAVISGYGTAAWFLIVFGAVGWAGWALTKENPMGRGPVAMLHIVLLPVAYYMFTSHRLEYALPVAFLGVAGLVLLLNPRAVQWAAARYAGR